MLRKGHLLLLGIPCLVAVTVYGGSGLGQSRVAGAKASDPQPHAQQPRGQQPPAPAVTARPRPKSDKGLAARGLHLWQAFAPANRVSTVKRSRLAGDAKWPLFRQAVFSPQGEIALNPEYYQIPEDYREEQNDIFIVRMTSGKAITHRVRTPASPERFVQSGSDIQYHTSGTLYRLYQNVCNIEYDDACPLGERIGVLNGAERIDAKTGASRWTPLKQVPESVRKSFLFALPDDLPEPYEHEDRPVVPQYRGPWTVTDWRGQVRARATAGRNRLMLSPEAWEMSSHIQSRGNFIYVIAGTIPTAPGNKDAARNDSSGYEDSQYGYDRSEATVYRFESGNVKVGRGGQAAHLQVLDASSRPPLAFLKRFEGLETRDALVLPGEAGVAYVWRSRSYVQRGSWRASSSVNLPSIAAGADAWAAMPDELFDVSALVVRWRDGSQSVIDIQMRYARKTRETYEQEEGDPARSSIVVQSRYRPRYQWTLNEAGRVVGRALPEQLSDDDDGEPTVLMSVSMRLKPGGVDARGRLAYFKGRELWVADLTKATARYRVAPEPGATHQ